MPTATATAEKPTFATDLDIAEPSRAKLIELLNARLADVLDLFTQTKHAHWNVKGPDFIQLHELFDDLAEHVEGHGDLIAERAVILGGRAHGTARIAAAHSKIGEYDLNAIDGVDHVQALSKQYAKVANAIRAAIKASDDADDPTTTDLFTQVSRQMDMDLWFLEAHLQAKR